MAAMALALLLGLVGPDPLAGARKLLRVPDHARTPGPTALPAASPGVCSPPPPCSGRLAMPSPPPYSRSPWAPSPPSASARVSASGASSTTS